jgi:hypothetical protein
LPLPFLITCQNPTISYRGTINAETELLEVLQVWLYEMKKPPSSYLTEMEIDFADQRLVRKSSESDFRTGNTISVRGIVLSKTEAAVLSLFAIATLL